MYLKKFFIFLVFYFFIFLVISQTCFALLVRGLTSNQQSGTITISGAWALYPMVVKWAEIFQKTNPKIKIDISAGGSGKGVADALSAVADIGMVSREIYPQEVNQGGWFVPVVKDAVFPIMNDKNPLAGAILKKGIKRRLLQKIWFTQDISTWNELLENSSEVGSRRYEVVSYQKYFDQKRQEKFNHRDTDYTEKNTQRCLFSHKVRIKIILCDILRALRASVLKIFSDLFGLGSRHDKAHASIIKLSNHQIENRKSSSGQWSVVSGQFSIFSLQPSAISHQPSTVGSRQLTISHQPSAISHPLRLNVYTRSDACGAADIWAKFLGVRQEDLNGIGVYGDAGLAEAVQQDIMGIGFTSVNYVYRVDGNPIKGIEIIPIDMNGNGKIDINENFYNPKNKLLKAVATGLYPSPPARELNFLTKGKPTKITREFILWVLMHGQKYVEETGYIPLSKEKLKVALVKVR